MATGRKKGACSALVEAAKYNCLQHNRREGHVPSYVNPNLTSTNRTVYEDDVIKTRKSIVPLVKRAELEYTHRTGRKYQKSFTPFREDVLKLKPGITDGQLMDFKAKAEALTGWKVVGIWLHQDEGYKRSKYIEGDEDYAINYHAHVLYDCVDHATGMAIRSQRKYFSIRQDLLADTTGMERGNKAAQTGIRHRQSARQRAMSQKQRIAELERIAKEKERQHQEELDAKDRVITQKESTIRSLQGKFDSLMGWVNSIWETLKGSLDAIVQRVEDERDYFTHEEVEAVEKGMVNAKDDKAREGYAKDICTIAATVTYVDEDIRADVMSIARRDYDPSEKIEEAEKQQRSWYRYP